ncbi:MAG: hypothetical protein HYR98_03310 [Nitrospirae bacterium]|nr:hypothetical protein [Nitrospirota bacterium]
MFRSSLRPLLILAVLAIPACNFASVLTVTYVESGSREFPVYGTGMSVSYDYDMTTSSDYSKYKDNVKSIHFASLTTEVKANSGSSGTVEIFMGPYGSGDVRKVAEATIPAGPETTGERSITWFDQGYGESLVSNDRKFRTQAQAVSAGANALVKVSWRVEIEAGS